MIEQPTYGAFVLATKYVDGDPHDHWVVGIYSHAYESMPGEYRHIVVDGDPHLPTSKPFRANGFRRVAVISVRKGHWLLANVGMIQRSKKSLWSYI